MNYSTPADFELDGETHVTSELALEPGWSPYCIDHDTAVLARHPAFADPGLILPDIYSR